MIERTFDVIVERDSEGWYIGSVSSLPGCHTQARSLDDLQERIREAILLCLEESGGGRCEGSDPVARSHGFCPPAVEEENGEIP